MRQSLTAPEDNDKINKNDEQLKEVQEPINGCFSTVDLLGFATRVAYLTEYVERKTNKTETLWNIQVFKNLI